MLPFSGSSTTPCQYTGRENEGTGVYFDRGRYFSPALQRFISEDPIGFRGGDADLYAYVGNSPTNYKDPFGMSRDCFASWCGGVPGNPLPGRKGNGSTGNGATSNGSTGNGATSNGSTRRPDPVVVAVTADIVGVAGTMTRNVPLGAAGAIISVANDPSGTNIAINALGFVPGLDMPIAFGGAAYEGSKFVTTQVLDPIFNAAPAQTIDDGNGHLIANPVFMNLEGEPN